MSRYIDADKALELVKDPYYKDFSRSIADITSLKELIEDTPTEDVKPVVHGEWIKDEECRWKCSVCGEQNKFAYAMDDNLYEIVLQDFYCPHCGAEMKRVNEE